MIPHHRIKKPLLIWLFFAFIFIVGISTFRDYGISWDERVERLDGAVALRYVEKRFGIHFHGLEAMLERQQYPASLDIHTYKDRYYPVGFNFPVEAALRFLNIESEQSSYYFRHFVTFSICLLGVFGIFLLALRRFNDWRLGLLAAVVYALSPRLYGEWFYNSKDLVLLSIFTFAMYWAISFLQRPNFRNALLFAVTTSLAMNIRLLAVVLPVLTIGMLAIQVIDRRAKLSKVVQAISLYCVSVTLLTIILWPLLWENPLTQIMDAFAFMAKYQFKQDMLYLGEVINSNALPWHYLPVWILITTPVAYSIFWLVGCIAFIRDSLHGKIYIWQTDKQMQDFFFLALFLGPIIGFLVLRPVIYDGWRHFYFIYPAFLLISVGGFVKMLHSTFLSVVTKRIFIAFVSATMLWTGVSMVLAHPFQAIYFNFLVGSNWKHKFDVDYWGLSNRKALQWILDHDQRTRLTIADCAYNFLPLSLSILNELDVGRLSFDKDQNNADYLITNYRLNMTDYAAMPSVWRLEKNIYSGNEIISSVYKSKRLIYESEVKVGKPIQFSKDSFGQYFLGSGNWAFPEAWGVWAESKKSHLRLPLPENSNQHPHRLVLSVRALVSSLHPTQEIRVRINSEKEKTFTLRTSDNNQLVLDLPMNLSNTPISKVLNIEIESLNPVSPSILGLGDDNRLLSFGLITATYKE